MFIHSRWSYRAAAGITARALWSHDLPRALRRKVVPLLCNGQAVLPARSLATAYLDRRKYRQGSSLPYRQSNPIDAACSRAMRIELRGVWQATNPPLDKKSRRSATGERSCCCIVDYLAASRREA
jgi:hypothetical protein